jgi:hypothetical protein
VVWLQLALTACDLFAWTQTILLDAELAKAEQKTLRYRLLRVAYTFASPSTGHGGTSWPQRSPDLPPFHSRCAPDRSTYRTTAPEDPRAAGTKQAGGISPHEPETDTQQDHQ